MDAPRHVLLRAVDVPRRADCRVQLNDTGVAREMGDMLLYGDLPSLLESSLSCNPELTSYFAAFRSGHSLRGTRSEGAKARKESTHLAQMAFLTAMLGRMANQHLSYLVQVELE